MGTGFEPARALRLRELATLRNGPAMRPHQIGVLYQLHSLERNSVLRYTTLDMDPANDQNSNQRREPEQDLVTWTAASRPFKRRDRQFYVTTFAMAGIVSLVLFLAEGFMPVLLIISLVFLYYVLSTVEPDNIEYKITSRGIKIADKGTDWQYLNRFWFTKRFDNELMIFDTVLIPGRIELVISPDIKSELKKEITTFIPYEEVPASGLDKLTNWFSSKLPGNK